MKFIVDRMFGKLAKWLRILGYDTVYYKGINHEDLLKIASYEDRIVITRNKKIFHKENKGRIIWINEDDLYLQLKELISKGVISFSEENHFSRCIICNKRLENISKQGLKGMVPDYIFLHHNEFSRCPQCNRIYWPGTHLENMKKRIEALLKDPNHQTQGFNECV